MPQRQSIMFFNEVVPKSVSEIFPFLYIFSMVKVKKITAVGTLTISYYSFLIISTNIREEENVNDQITFPILFYCFIYEASD